MTRVKSVLFVVVLTFLQSPARGDAEVSCVFNERCILPCSFQAGADVVVQWVHTTAKDRPVHSYNHSQDQLLLQDQRFRGRTSLFQDQISSGDASLQLTGVNPLDQGRYRCYTRTTTGTQESFISLKVDAPVREVHIQQVGNRITCSSEGIYPQPELTWSTEPPSTQILQIKTTVQETEQRLHNISSYLTVSDADLVYSCTVSTCMNKKKVTLFKQDAEVSCVFNERCILPCSFQAGADVVVQWVHTTAEDRPVHSYNQDQDQLLLQDQDQLLLQDQRFRGRTSLFQDQISSGDASLQLTGVNPLDQGRYRCYTRTTTGTQESFISLKVDAPVREVHIQQVGNRITCSSEGIYPQPELTWSTEPPSTQILQIKTTVQETEQRLHNISSYLTVSDADLVYSCTVSTCMNKKKVTLFKPDAEVSCVFNERCILPCSFQAGADVVVQWVHTTAEDRPVHSYNQSQDQLLLQDQDQLLLQDQRFRGRTSLFQDQISSGDASLRLTGVNPLDQGRYRCYTRTTTGTQESFISLKVDAPVREVHIQQVGNRITCSSEGIYPQPELTWSTEPPSTQIIQIKTTVQETEQRLHNISSYLTVSDADLVYSCTVSTCMNKKKVTLFKADAQVSCVFNERCILPCSFQAGADVVVQWVHTTAEDRPVHSYNHSQDQLLLQDQDQLLLQDQDQLLLQDQRFRGRTSLFQDQISSGDASLRLTGVNPLDQGRYRCYTRTTTGTQESFISLKVDAPVREVHIQQVGNRISCSSEGIYPQPELTWSTEPPSTQILQIKTTVQETEQRLHNISSYLTVSDADLVYSCTVSTCMNKKKVTLFKADAEVSCVFNERCILPCSFQAGADVVVQWVHTTAKDRPVHSYNHSQDQLLLQDQDQLLLQDQRFRGRTSLFQDQISSGDASLRLTGVNPLDQGRYRCYTRTTTGTQESFISLKVDAPVREVHIQQVGNRISCSSEGIYPQPELTWSTEPPSTQILQIKTTVQETEQRLHNISSYLTVSDADLVYSCTVSTCMNKKKVTLFKPDAQVSCVFNERCILPCSFQAGADVVVQWVHTTAKDRPVHSYNHSQDQLLLQDQDQLLLQDQRFRGRTSLFQDQISSGDASLQLTGVNPLDQGRYRCYTRTTTGTQESFISLKVDAPVREVHIQQVGNRITCSSEGIYPQPELTWSTEPPSTQILQIKTTVQETEQRLHNISSYLTVSDADLVYSCTVSTCMNKKKVTLFKPASMNSSSTEATISCTSSNSPHTGLIWRFNHSQIILNRTGTNGPETVSEEWRQQVERVSESGSLTLKDLSAKHDGTYTCELSDDEGTKIKNTTLKITKVRSTPAKRRTGPSKAAIAVGVIGAILALVLIGLAAHCIRKRGQRAATCENPPPAPEAVPLQDIAP